MLLGMERNESLSDLDGFTISDRHFTGASSVSIGNFSFLKEQYGESKVKAIAFSSNSGTAANNIRCHVRFIL